MVYTAQYPSPLGMITLASDGQNLTGLWLEGQKYFASTLKGKMPLQEEPPVLQAAKGGWTGILRGRSRRLTISLWLLKAAGSSRKFGSCSVKSPMGR